MAVARRRNRAVQKANLRAAAHQAARPLMPGIYTSATENNILQAEFVSHISVSAYIYCMALRAM